MSHQQSNPNGDSDRSGLPSYGIRDLYGCPLPNHEQYLSSFPSPYPWVGSAAVVLHEGRPDRDLAERWESTTPQHISSDPALGLYQLYSAHDPIAPPNHTPGSGSSMQHGGLTDSLARDERPQVNARVPPPNSSEQGIQEYIPRRPEQYQLHYPESRARRDSQPQTMPDSASINASGSRPNREHLNFGNDSLISGASRHTAMVVQPDVASQPSLGSTHGSSLLAGGSQSRFPLSLQGLQNARTRTRITGRRVTALRPTLRKPPPANIVRYTALSASDVSNVSDPECPICQDSYDGDQHIAIKLLTTPCAHTFGRSCLQQWVNSGMNNAHRCPACRQSIAGALSVPQPSPHLGLVIGTRIAPVMQELERQRQRATVSALQAEFGQLQQEQETGPTSQEARQDPPAGFTHHTRRSPDVTGFTASEMAHPALYYWTQAYQRDVALIGSARELDVHTTEQIHQAQGAVHKSQESVARSQENIVRA